MLLEETFLDKAAIRDDRDGLHLQGLLAEIDHLAEELGVEEGFPAGKVDLSRASLFKPPQTLLSALRSFNV